MGSGSGVARLDLIAAPYYQDERITLYHGDCLELSPLWTGADVLVTDPPYGMAYRARGTYDSQTGKTHAPAGAKHVAGDHSTAIRDQALAEWGSSRPAAVFGTWRVSRPPAVQHRLIWWKQGQPPGPARAPFMLQDEEIYILGSGWLATSPPLRSVMATGEHRSQEVSRVGHPTPKPVPLMETLLRQAPPQWVIADPFAGSGATRVAASLLGRKAIGVELEEKYCELIAKRLSQGVFTV